MALTLDACGGRGGEALDADLIALLRRERVPATLFLNARWVRANPRLADDLAADDLFCIANHGTSHRPLSVDGRSAYGIAGTRSVEEVIHEVMGAQEVLTRLSGTPPRFFRSGTAHYDDVAVRIVNDLGLVPVGFDVNLDAGATLGGAAVAREVRSLRTGSIGIGHMNQPSGGTAEGLAAALPGMLADGVTFARLDHVIR